MYNFQLYNNWCDAAMRLGLEIKSKSGGCIYMQDPVTETIIGKEGTGEQQFFFMLWTPLNKLGSVFNDLPDWKDALDTLKDNHSDFHIEAAKMYCDDNSHYLWFPEFYNQTDISVDDIMKCVKRIRDFDNHSKWQTFASLKAESVEETA
jgi:hypothetical protein